MYIPPVDDDILCHRGTVPLESHHFIAEWHDPLRRASLLSFRAKQGTDFPHSPFWIELGPQMCVSDALQVSLGVCSLLLAVGQVWFGIVRLEKLRHLFEYKN